MTVNTTGNKITYAANGSTTVWTFPFPGVSASYIEVFITDSLNNVIQLPTNAYTIALNPPIDPNPTGHGGTVTYPIAGPPLAVGNSITILRTLPAVQSTSISNQSIVYPPVIEQEFDYLTMLDQEGIGDLDRAFKVGFSDPIPALVPPVAQRAGLGAFFDSLGNLTAGAIPGPGVFISAAMIPVVEAATIPLAQVAFGLGPNGYSAIDGSKSVVTAAYVVVQSDRRKTLVLKGNAYYSVSIGDPAGYDTDFQVYIINNDTRGKLISPFGVAAFMLWPNQFCILTRAASGWLVGQQARWRPGYSVNFYVNNTLGNDSNDGLAVGTGAFQTVQHAINVVEAVCDGQFTIIPQQGTHNVLTGIVCTKPCIGSDGYLIAGAGGGPQDQIFVAFPGSQIITVIDNAVVSFQNAYLTTSAGDGNGVYATRGAIANLTNISFGSFAGSHINADGNATLRIIGNYTIYGNAAVHIAARGAATVIYLPTIVGIAQPIAITYFLYFIFSSNLDSLGVAPVFSNAGFVTGTQYAAQYNSVIYFSGATPPGTIPGSVSLGGIFA